MKVKKMIGLMSGTSLDGLDLVYCHIQKTTNGWDFKIKHTQSTGYTNRMRKKLRDSILLSSEDLLELHTTYGTWLGEQTKVFIEENGLDVDYVASHGHTTHHRPEKGFTFQIGSGQHLANACGQKVVCDFRTNDVALEGQGAPLVPIGDRLFFGQYDFCLNLGGISNISFEHNGNRIAYDIGLANMVLNYITQKDGLLYDAGGQLASKGNVNSQMLQQLNDLDFYRLPFPKSIGYEWFIEKVVPIINKTQDSMENLLCTSVHHVCEQIAIQVSENMVKTKNTVLVTGGGALNHYLIETLRQKLGAATEIIVPDKTLIEFKEALVFALMGALRVEQEINIFRSVTGAKRDSSSGVVFFPG